MIDCCPEKKKKYNKNMGNIMKEVVEEKISRSTKKKKAIGKYNIGVETPVQKAVLPQFQYLFVKNLQCLI